MLSLHVIVTPTFEEIKQIVLNHTLTFLSFLAYFVHFCIALLSVWHYLFFDLRINWWINWFIITDQL